MSIDIAHFQEELEQARERLNRTIEHHDIGTASLEEETGELLSRAPTTTWRTLRRRPTSASSTKASRRTRASSSRQVEKALARIESGEYGRCEVCGKEIPVERLEAVPWTTLCIDDARRLAR